MNPTMDAVYILSPKPHIVDCLLADLDRRRYRRAFIVWTSVLNPKLQQRIDSTPSARQQIAGFDMLSVDFYPRESNLITFRDPWSFPVLYHPGCNSLVRQHMDDLAQKVSRAVEKLAKHIAKLTLCTNTLPGRSQASAFRQENTPRFGTTDQGILRMRQACCARILHALFKKSLTSMHDGIETFRRNPQDSPAFLSLPTDRWI